jgi:hypothetical protein
MECAARIQGACVRFDAYRCFVSSLLRVEQNPTSPEPYRLLGYEWLEILWVEPWALAIPDEGWGTWCDRRVAVQYVCMTESGVARISADDFWMALEEYEEYVTAEGECRDSPPPLQIVASAGSVVHVGGSVGSSFGTVASAGSAMLTQSSSWDFGALAAEIKTLREAAPADLPERDSKIYAGTLAEAEVAAEERDVGKLTSALRRVGVRVATSASDLGLAMLEAYCKRQAGL